MDSIFLDTDVILDFLLDRKPFSEHMDQLFALAEAGGINVYASSLSFNNIYYISRKSLGHNKAIEVLGELLETIQVLNVGEKEIKKALEGRFSDFEDAIQDASSLNVNGLAAIVTRNKKDYKMSEQRVLTPKEYLETLK